MAKSKYKIGNFVRFQVEGGSDTGTIEGIVTRSDGFSYQMEDREGFLLESDVIAAYKEIKQRSPKKKSAPKASRSKSNGSGREVSLSQ